ncbi:MAG TPA: transposase [Chitinophagaceae bacterium]|jgi:transposase
MKIQHIIGADLSKKAIDLYCYQFGSYLKIENSYSGFQVLIKWMKEQGVDPSETMIVMEHTGLYSFCFEHFLHHDHISFCKVNALAIKRSMGIVRGKTDKLDAARIATYGYQKRETLVATGPVSDDLARLQMIYSTRERLVRQRASLICAVKEYRHIGLSEKDIIMASQVRIIKNLDREIEKLVKEMGSIVDKQKSMKQNFSLLTGITGVGPIIALTVIIKTHNFTRFSDARKFACFCGTAPFEHSSGTSIRKHSRVSHLADKKMKSLLDLAAKSAIQHDKELKQYYLKRTEGGKSKMSTINIIRNKLLYRMFAVIKRQTPFLKSYPQVA